MDENENILENLEENFEETAFDEDFFEDAMERLQLSKDAFTNIYQDYKDDISFGLLGQQWSGETLGRRKRDNRTVAVFNKCVPMIRHVVNSNMQNPPAITVRPISNNKKEESDIIEGIVRHIENESNSKDIRTNTLQDAVAGGIGVWEIVIDEESGEPRERRIVDPTSVYPDPSAIDPSMCDIKWLFHLKSISCKEYERKYGKPTKALESKKDWYSSDNVTIAEYWIRENGKVSWYILDGEKVLDSSEKFDEFGNLIETYPGKYIPYCFVIGEDIQIDDTRVFKSIIRDVKDYQRTMNYMQSEAIDYVSKNSNAPYIISDKNIQVYGKYYEVMNTRNAPYIPYVDGTAKPDKTPPPPAPIGYLEEINRLDLDIRSTIGIRDPLQDIPQTASGKAIKLQISQSNIGTYAWSDHLNRAIKQSGKILVDLIQKYYNYPHIQQILGLDGNIQTASIQIPEVDENGYPKKMLDLEGEYAVNISTGPSYEDQRSESYDKLLELFKINPMLAQIGSDIFVRNMDFKESEILADRIHSMLDPRILQSEKSEENPKIQLQMLSQKFEQSQKLIEQLTQTLNVKNSEVQQLQSNIQNKNQLESEKNAVNLMIQNSKNETELQKTMMETSAEIKMKEMEKEIEMLKSMFNQTIKNLNVEHNNTTIF